MYKYRDAVYFIIILLLIALCGQFYYTYTYKPQAARDVTVYYNKQKEANLLVINAIQNADQYVHFAIYTFTRTDIQDALIGAKHRGVEVIGVVDKEQIMRIEAQRNIVKELEKAGITIYQQDHSAIMHLKLIVTEKEFVSGSYNWTTSATTSNDEVLEVGRDEDLRRQYEDVIQELFRRYSPG